MTKADCMVGGVAVGGGAPVTIQSMCNTKTDDVAATVAQIHRSGGGRAARSSGWPCRTMAAAGGGRSRIREQIHIPLVADIHFDYRCALECADRGMRRSADQPRQHRRGGPGEGGGGRLPGKGHPHPHRRQRRLPGEGAAGRSTAASPPRPWWRAPWATSRLLNQFDFDDICISVKCSDVPLTMAAYRLLSERTRLPPAPGGHRGGHPLHGDDQVRHGHRGPAVPGHRGHHPGDADRGPGGGGLRRQEDPEGRAASGRTGVNLIACPTCGRTRIDLIPLAEEVERRLPDCPKPITVAVMGCAVNGPGEAAAADIGIAGGSGEGLLFRKGEILCKVPQEQLVDELDGGDRETVKVRSAGDRR